MATEEQQVGVGCRHCGRQNAPEARFCAFCGGPLLIECANCRKLNPTEAVHCSECGHELDDFQKASACLERAVSLLHDGNHHGAFETAEHGLKQYRSLEKKLRACRDQAATIIDGDHREVRTVLEEARRVLGSNTFPQALEHLEAIAPKIAVKLGTDDLRPEADELRAEAERQAADHRARLERAAELEKRGRLRRACELVAVLMQDYPWDDRLPGRLAELRAALAEADELRAAVAEALEARAFREALEVCGRLRRLEPDHPELAAFEEQAQHDRQVYNRMMRRVRSRMEGGRFLEATDAVRKLAEAYPRDEKAAAARQRMEWRVEAADLFNRAKAGRGGIVVALRAWERILGESPEDPEASAAVEWLRKMAAAQRRRRIAWSLVAGLAAVLLVGVMIGSASIRNANGQHIDTARALVEEGRFEEAEAELAAMWPIFLGERDEVAASIRRGRVFVDRDAAAEAREWASEAGAAALAGRLWDWGNNMMRQAERDAESQRWDEAREQWATAAEVFAAAEAQAAYESRLERLDRGVLEEFGGERWERIETLVRRADSSNDFERIAEAYRDATELLGEAYRAALDAEAELRD